MQGTPNKNTKNKRQDNLCFKLHVVTLSVHRKDGFIENRRLVKTAVILSFFVSLLRKHAILRVDKDQCHRQGQRRVIEWTSLRIYRKLKISGFEKAGENMLNINRNYLPRRVLHQRLSQSRVWNSRMA